jgi:hypothetical protein
VRAPSISGAGSGTAALESGSSMSDIIAPG